METIVVQIIVLTDPLVFSCKEIFDLRAGRQR